MTLRVLIVDDEPLARARLRRLLGDCRQPEAIAAAEAATAAEAMTQVRHQSFDAVLLDVHMPGVDGMTLAASWQDLADKPAVIFVTAHPEYAVRAFEVNAVDYLTKPVRQQRLQVALQKVAALRATAAGSSATPPEYVVVTTHDSTVRVPLAEVLYFKAEDKYVVAQTRHREYLLDDSLVQLERAHAVRFLRVHRNALVARNAIRALVRERVGADTERWKVQLSGTDATLAVSRRQLPQVRAILAGQAPE